MAKTATNKKRSEARKKKNNLTVILIIAAFAIVVVVMIIVSQQAGKINVVLPDRPAKPQPSGLNMGDPNAPVKVVEFADYQCSVCHLYWQDLEPSIIATYVATGKVYYTFANFAFFGQESSDAAAAAYCANDQGKFWEYHDVIFANYKGENAGGFTPANLTAFADKLGLDMTAFKACFEGGKYAQQVIDEAAYARSQNITGTPSFLVNGTLVYASDLATTIDAALAGK